MTEIRTAAAAREVALVDGKPPARIQLLAIGANRRRDGAQPPYLVRDRAHAEQIVAASQAYHGSTDVMVDYDHQSVFGAKDGVGGRAPAAGWLSGLSVDDDGIGADVEWTRAAGVALGRREYRYISPYFGHRADGTVTRIFNAALTNRPELELRAVASQSDVTHPTEGSIMLKTIALALGLAEGATEADIVTAAKAAKAATDDRTAVCSALGLGADAGSAELRTAASAKTAPDPAKYVPIAELTSLRARLDAIEETRVTASVDDAIAAGKVTPGSRDWALGYARKDPEGFATFVGAAPVVVEQGAEQRRAAAVREDKLTDEERAICSQLGVSEADYLKHRKENA